METITTRERLEQAIKKHWPEGNGEMSMRMGVKGIQELIQWVEDEGCVIRAGGVGKVHMAMHVTGYIHPASGKVINILTEENFAGREVEFLG